MPPISILESAKLLLRLMLRFIFYIFFICAYVIDDSKLILGEIIHKTYQQYSSLKTVSYTTVIKTTVGQSESFSQAVVTLQKNRNNIPSLRLEMLTDNEMCLFDGLQLITFYYEGSIASIVNHRKYPEITKNYLGRRYVSNVLETSFTNKSLIKLLIDNAYQSKLRDDEFVNNDICYTIRTEFSDSNDVKKRSILWYIGKNDFVPRRIILEHEIDNELFQRDILFTNINFAPKISDTTFTIKEVPDTFLKKEYSPLKGSSSVKSANASGLLIKGTKAPDWQIVTITGDTLSLSMLKGKIIVIDFWHMYCIPCLKAIPEMVRIHQRFSHRNVVVIGMNSYYREKDLLSLHKFLQKKNASYTVAICPKEILEKYRVGVSPTSYIVDAEGRVYASFAGYSESVLEDTLKNYLKEIGF